MASTMLRPRLPRVALSLRRYQHFLPQLKPEFEGGIPGLFTPDGFQMAWTQYQLSILDKLNQQTAGSATDNSMKTKDLVFKYARDSNKASVFNHASMAHNNHFFFSCLSTEPTTMPLALQEKLEETFGSIETLKAEFLATANAMFGPGFVWLVRRPDMSFGILATYIAGSPYAQAHYRMQSRDLNTERPDLTTLSDHARQAAIDSMPIVNSVGAHGSLSEAGKESSKPAPGSVAVRPVLCVNTWEHVWLRDWGIGNKRAFLEAWWDRVDWNVVADNADAHSAGR